MLYPVTVKGGAAEKEPGGSGKGVGVFPHILHDPFPTWGSRKSVAPSFDAENPNYQEGFPGILGMFKYLLQHLTKIQSIIRGKGGVSIAENFFRKVSISAEWMAALAAATTQTYGRRGRHGKEDETDWRTERA